MDILIFIIILFILVVVHEWGHYYAAKKSGVRVEEFGFGLPPRLFGKKFGKAPAEGQEDDRTLFSFNALPIGGFVRMSGEDSMTDNPEDPKSFQNAKLRNRMVIVLAGVVMNFILGIGLFATVYTLTGIPENPRVLVQEVSPGSPAETAGLKSQDIIYSINGKQTKSVGEVQQLISKTKSGAQVEVKRGEEMLNFNLTPRLEMVNGKERNIIGVALDQKIDFNKSYPFYEMPLRGIALGWQDTVEMAKQIVPALSNLVSSILLERSVPNDVSGPVGIAKASSLFCGSGILPCMQFAGLLSINLAIFNLLPFPALDGGRFVFMVYEAITRRKANQKIEQWAHTIGFLLLLLLIIAVTYKDIFVGTGM